MSLQEFMAAYASCSVGFGCVQYWPAMDCFRHASSIRRSFSQCCPLWPTGRLTCIFLASKTEEQITNVSLLAKATGLDELHILGKELPLLQVSNNVSCTGRRRRLPSAADAVCTRVCTRQRMRRLDAPLCTAEALSLMTVWCSA